MPLGAGGAGGRQLVGGRVDPEVDRLGKEGLAEDAVTAAESEYRRGHWNRRQLPALDGPDQGKRGRRDLQVAPEEIEVIRAPPDWDGLAEPRRPDGRVGSCHA